MARCGVAAAHLLVLTKRLCCPLGAGPRGARGLLLAVVPGQRRLLRRGRRSRYATLSSQSELAETALRLHVFPDERCRPVRVSDVHRVRRSGHGGAASLQLRVRRARHQHPRGGGASFTHGQRERGALSYACSMLVPSCLPSGAADCGEAVNNCEILTGRWCDALPAGVGGERAGRALGHLPPRAARQHLAQRARPAHLLQAEGAGARGDHEFAKLWHRREISCDPTIAPRRKLSTSSCAQRLWRWVLRAATSLSGKRAILRGR